MSQPELESCVICHDCDLLINMDNLPEGFKASCPRCGFTISAAHKDALNRILIFSLTALLCLLFSNLFSFVALTVQGQDRNISLFDTVKLLFNLQEWSLGIFVLLIIIALPILCSGMLCWLALTIKFKLATRSSITLLRIVEFLRFWNMAEIFFLGILISIIKIASMATISFGYSFWAYALFNVSFIAALINFDKHQLALEIRRIVNSPLMSQH